MRVPSFTAALAAVRRTELIAVIPRRFARRFADPDRDLCTVAAPREI